MKIRSLFISMAILLSVITFSLNETRPTLAESLPATPTTSPIDLSGVNWTELARLVYGKCGEWHDLAISIGWSEAQWPTLSRVLHRESRCSPTSYYKADPNGGSHGLMQINGYWCRKNKYNPSGWLQARGILSTCNDLYIPEVNLRAGLAMWNYSQQANKCGWRPWAIRC